MYAEPPRKGQGKLEEKAKKEKKKNKNQYQFHMQEQSSKLIIYFPLSFFVNALQRFWTQTKSLSLQQTMSKAACKNARGRRSRSWG